MIPIKSTVMSENLIPNSDFETGLAGWSEEIGSFSLTTEEVHNGSVGVKMTTDDGQAVIKTNKITGLVDSYYYLSLWINKEFFPASASVEINWYTDGGNHLQGYTIIDLKPYLGWTQITWQGEKYDNLTDTFQLSIYSYDPDDLVYHIYLDEVWFASSPNPDYPQPVKADNLVFNSNFETSVTGWSPRYGTISRTSEDVHNGSYCMKMESEVKEDGEKMNSVESAPITDLDDSIYYLSILVNKDLIINTAAVSIDWYKESDYQGMEWISFREDKGWTQLTWNGTKFDAETDSCRIIIYGNEPSFGADFVFYVDEVWFSHKPYPHDYQVTLETTPFFSDNLMYFVFILVLTAWIKRKYQ